jgi:hypothetical protein
LKRAFFGFRHGEILDDAPHYGLHCT